MNIGLLQNLKIDNQGGQHNIYGGSLDASGKGSIINIAQSEINNQGGQNNIQLDNGGTSGEGAVLNIGLLLI